MIKVDEITSAFSRGHAPEFVEVFLKMNGRYIADEDLPVNMTLDDVRRYYYTYGCGRQDEMSIESITINLARKKVSKLHLKIIRRGRFFKASKHGLPNSLQTLELRCGRCIGS